MPYLIALCICLLFSCAKDEEIPPQAPEPVVQKTENPSLPPVWLACESTQDYEQIYLLSSQATLQLRNSSNSLQGHAPAIVGKDGEIFSLVYREAPGIFFSQTPGPPILLREEKNVPYAADRNYAGLSSGFFILGEDRHYSVRSLSDPQQKQQKREIWKISPQTYQNPRWNAGLTPAEEIVFFDVKAKTKLRQAFALVSQNKLQSLENLPNPGLRGAHQIGLRQFDQENLLWLEWTKDKSQIALMNFFSRKVRYFPTEGKFLPSLGFLRKDRVGNLVALASDSSIHFFHWKRGKLKELRRLDYSDSILEAGKRTGTFPAAFYSAAKGEELFILLNDLDAYGIVPRLFSLGRARKLKMVDERGCQNPGFFEEN